MSKTPLMLLCTVMATVCAAQAAVAWKAFGETGDWIFLAFLAVAGIAAAAIAIIGLLVIKEKP